MNERLQRYLDGELPREELPEELRAEARRWEARIGGAREQGPSGMPPGLEDRVMRAVRGEATRPGWARAWSWLRSPREIAVSPLAAATGLALVAALALLPWWMLGRDGDSTVIPAPEAGAVEVYVEFALEAPAARSVAVAGDFNAWTPRVELQDPDGDGVWAGRVRLEPGVHKYMFVVDGSRWVTDPRAARHVDDGFGNRNAVLVVPGGSRS